MSQNLVTAVRTHALANYAKGGWDYIVECWSDDDIRAAIGTARTESGAIKKVAAAIKPLADYRDDIRAEAF